MSATETTPIMLGIPTPGARPASDLFQEAERQLNVCNSCRYCAGYCPVWPSLEKTTVLSMAQMAHLGNLCHDCRDCFTACMYTAPHEFDLNPPRIFAEIREETYDRYIPGRRALRRLPGWSGTTIGFVLAAVVIVLLSLGTDGGALFVSGPQSGSPYELVGHTAMIALAVVPTIASMVVLLVAALRYWSDTNSGSFRGLFDLAAWGPTLSQTARMKHQTGGAEGCSYEENEPSSRRRYAHHLVMYGFLLTFAATVSAWAMATFLGLEPPYPLFSVPKITGILGGVMASIGCLGMLWLKPRSDRSQTTDSMRKADYGLIWATLLLMVSGLAAHLTNGMMAYGPVLVFHLATVVACFAITPYTKFVHWIFRMLAVQKDNVERHAVARAAAAQEKATAGV